jgi:hypothetical protein
MTKASTAIQSIRMITYPIFVSNQWSKQVELYHHNSLTTPKPLNNSTAPSDPGHQYG